MSEPKGKHTAAQVRARLRYVKSTGKFYWRERPRGWKRADLEAGSPMANGYIQIVIDKQHYLAHRLAVLIVTGQWPVGVVDHRNRKPSHNQWRNLRDTNQSVNTINAGMWRHNTSGVKGVSRTAHGWRAYFRGRHIGYYSTRTKAAKARQRVETAHGRR